VEGDAGIGKTLLCEELAHEVLGAGDSLSERPTGIDSSSKEAWPAR
jgi:hypothetical protein